ncbi:hypothetical protein [Marinobacter shengliensis]|uniref:hypothetical protein n=1 Tax=Marinobacter shengliensis TaxID=1389223 RepID=UPI001108D489|nr:hypothetical protein [Marinobacter shengliensis]
MEFEDEMFKAMMLNNMNWVVNFHNHVKGAMNYLKKEMPSFTHLKENDITYWNHVYENEFPGKLRQTTFLLMFGHLEEMLYLLWKEDKSSEIELAKGNGVSKYKPFIKSCLGNRFGSFTEYTFIVNAQEIRNSLLHIAGRVSMMKNPEKLEKIIKSSKGLYSKKSDRVEISVEAISKLQQSINELLEELHLSIISRNKGT